jgi:enamine deaminase RidA (YjgF/YER057c/UK114 family)
MSYEDSLKKHHIELPEAPNPVGSYVASHPVGNLFYTSGMLPMNSGHLAWVGKVGRDLSLDEARIAARQCVMNLLALVKAEYGTIDCIEQVISITGYVNGIDGFSESPAVLNGASDFLVDILGDAGKHTRSAVSVNGLPMGAPVEISAIFQISI